MRKKRIRPEATSRLRNWQCGEVYHVFQRGNYKQQTFYTEEHLVQYLQRLGLLAQRYAVRIHAFCLMSNHIHFLLEATRKDGISRLMQALQSYHSRWIHRGKGLDGHLWKNRFGAKRITSAAHFHEALLYVERNPAEAGLTRRPERYAYSSAAAHCAKAEKFQIRHGRFEAEIHLYLRRWETDCDQTRKWRNWLRDPKREAIDHDVRAAIEKIVGRDLHPVALPLPRPMARAAPLLQAVERFCAQPR